MFGFKQSHKTQKLGSCVPRIIENKDNYNKYIHRVQLGLLWCMYDTIFINVNILF